MNLIDVLSLSLWHSPQGAMWLFFDSGDTSQHLTTYLDRAGGELKGLITELLRL